MMATAGPRFDIARFGMERFSATPRQADLMIVAGRGRACGCGRVGGGLSGPGSSARASGGCLGGLGDRLAGGLRRDWVEFDGAVVKFVVDRDELTLHVRRALLPQVAPRLRDEPQ